MIEMPGLGRALDTFTGVELALTEERANALGRIGDRLERAIRAWEELRDDGAASDDDRDEALSEVREALWMLVVQRECSGFRLDNHAWVRQHYDVPPEVWARV